MTFTKPYEGSVTRDGETKHVCFYDEREWRWVPQNLPEDLRWGIDSSEFVNGRPPQKTLSAYAQRRGSIFSPNDIRYIIVSTESEVLRFGPFEWLWRTLTYMQFQPMRRPPAGVLSAAES